MPNRRILQVPGHGTSRHNVASIVRVGRNGENGRAGEIRTHDLLHPMQARYQATLQPEQKKGQQDPRPKPTQEHFRFAQLRPAGPGERCVTAPWVVLRAWHNQCRQARDCRRNRQLLNVNVVLQLPACQSPRATIYAPAHTPGSDGPRLPHLSHFKSETKPFLGIGREFLSLAQNGNRDFPAHLGPKSGSRPYMNPL